jgi:hypothetical protein
MYGTFRMLFVALMTGTLLSEVNEYVRIVRSFVKRGRPVCIAAEGTVPTESKVKVKRGGPVSVGAEGTATDGIKDRFKAQSTCIRSRSTYCPQRNQGSHACTHRQEASRQTAMTNNQTRSLC